MWRRFMPGEQEKIYAGLDSRRNINAIRYLLFCVDFFHNCVNAVTPGNDSGDETAEGNWCESRADAWTRYGGILLNGMEKNRNGRSPQPSAEWRGNARRFRRGEYNFWGEDGKGYEFSEDGKTEKT